MIPYCRSSWRMPVEVDEDADIVVTTTSITGPQGVDLYRPFVPEIAGNEKFQAGPGPMSTRRRGVAVNWADLRGVDVEVSLLDGIVTVTIEGAAPEAVELCRFVSEELELSWRACSMATCRPRRRFSTAGVRLSFENILRDAEVVIVGRR